MSFNEFAFWLLTGMMGLCCIVLGWFLARLLDELKGIHSSIAGLNNHVAVVIEKQTWHEKELTYLKEKIETLEQKRTKKNA